MRHLELYEEYSREEVHDIFAPLTSFTLQRGTWGLHGIVLSLNVLEILFFL